MKSFRVKTERNNSIEIPASWGANAGGGHFLRRKDGKQKRKARRNKPEFEFAFRTNPNTKKYRHKGCDSVRTPGHHTVVSLFCGCGGLDLGITGGFRYLNKRYDALPFDILHAVDNLGDAVETYKLNIGDHVALGDLTEIDVADLPKADVLMGGFPCQDFSSCGPKVGFSGKRGRLYQVLTEYMHHHRPMVVIGENVPYLKRLNGGEYLSAILRDFEDAGYTFEVWDLHLPEYGLSQSRRRLFLVGVRNDLEGFPVQPTPTHADKPVYIDACLEDLEGIEDESVTNQSQYFIATRATAGGGQGDHTNKAGTFAYCIRANARGRIQFHYKLPRRLTVRECARLQSFPDEFVFPFTTQRNLTLIGNAVPPIVGHAVGTAIAEFMAAAKKQGNKKKQQAPHAEGKQTPESPTADESMAAKPIRRYAQSLLFDAS